MVSSINAWSSPIAPTPYICPIAESHVVDGQHPGHRRHAGEPEHGGDVGQPASPAADVGRQQQRRRDPERVGPVEEERLPLQRVGVVGVDPVHLLTGRAGARVGDGAGDGEQRGDHRRADEQVAADAQPERLPGGSCCCCCVRSVGAGVVTVVIRWVLSERPGGARGRSGCRCDKNQTAAGPHRGSGAVRISPPPRDGDPSPPPGGAPRQPGVASPGATTPCS